MFTASAWRAPRHAASSGSDKEQLCQLRGIGPVKQNFKAKLCSRIRFFAHLSLIAGQISHLTLPFGHTHT
jgi:hypothetical protein